MLNRLIYGSGVGSEVARKSIKSLCVRLGGMGATFAAEIYLARLLGVDAFGDYAYAFTLLNIVAILSTRGMDAAGVRFVPAYSVKQQWRLLRGFLRHSKSIVLMTSSVISLLSLALIFVFRDALGPSLAGTMAFACLILPVFSLGQVLSSILLGFDRVVVARAPLEILRFLFLILFAFFFFQLLTMPPTAPLGMVFNLAATLITIGILMLGLRRAVPGKTKSAGLEYSKKQWNSVAWQMFLGAGFILVLNRTGIVLVGIFLGTTDAGIYYVASHLTTLILLGLQSVNYIVGPMISRLHTAGRHAELQRMTTISTWAIMLVTLPLCIGLLILGQFALSLFGSEFTVGYAALFILVLGQTVSALVGPVGLLTSMTGHQHVTAIVQGVGAGLNVILNLIFIPMFGIVGAAAAMAITTAGWKLALLVFVYRRLHINATVFTRLVRVE